MTVIRKSTQKDCLKILKLYKQASKRKGSLAREEHEINELFISHFLTNSLNRGLSLVIKHDNLIVGEIHAYSPEIAVFKHIFTELTICIHPDYQGQSFGKQLFNRFMKMVRDDFLQITRVELIARESNNKAIEFYKKLGFEIEGCFRNRINGINSRLENDIPMAWLRTKET